MARFLKRMTVGAVLLVTMSSAASASSPFSTTAKTGAGNSIASPPGADVTGTNSASAASTANNANLTSDLRAGATAVASVGGGFVKTYAVATANSAGPGTTGSSATATGALNDQFVIACGTCAPGSRGTMVFAVRLDGRLVGDGSLNLGGLPGYADGNWSALGQWQFNLNLNTTSPGNFGFGNTSLSKAGTQSYYTGAYQATGDNFGTYVLSVPFVFGGTNFLNIYGLAAATADTLGVVYGNGGTVDAISSFSTDLSHTFAWGGITELRDSNGTLISNFTAMSGLTGFNYANAYTSAAAVPEPASWALMLFGFGGVGAALRRRSAALA